MQGRAAGGGTGRGGAGRQAARGSARAPSEGGRGQPPAPRAPPQRARPRTQRRAHQVQVLVDAVALDGRDDVVVQEVLAQVLDVHGGRADLQRLAARGLKVLLLPQVGAVGHDLVALLAQPHEHRGRVQAAAATGRGGAGGAGERGGCAAWCEIGAVKSARRGPRVPRATDRAAPVQQHHLALGAGRAGRRGGGGGGRPAPRRGAVARRDRRRRGGDAAQRRLAARRRRRRRRQLARERSCSLHRKGWAATQAISLRGAGGRVNLRQ